MNARRAPRAIGRRVGRAAFGDRVGLVVWLALVAWFALLWRLDLAITDTNVFANVLVALSDGSLAVTELRFPLDTVGGQHVQQGLRVHDGSFYGRNYGQVALAVPVLWVLEAVAGAFDLRLLLATGWSLLVLALIDQVGTVAGVPRRGRLAGAALGGATFLGSVVVATDVDGRLLPVVALQLVNLLAAAGIGLLVYRLVDRFHGRRVGAAAGLATGLATPVAFWATFPKRHVLVAFIVLCGVLAFARSRDSDGGGRERRLARGTAYGAMGLVAWIHAAEGFFLVGALAAVDLATADGTRPRELAVVTGALALALTPTVLTNVAITGNPLVPPRLVGRGASGSDLLETATMVTTVGPVGASVAGGAGLALLEAAGVLPETVGAIGARAWDLLAGGLAALGEPARLWHTFARSGNYEGLVWTSPAYEPAELSVLESAPLLGAVVAVPVAGFRRARHRANGGAGASVLPTTARGQTDLLVCAIAAAVTLLYLPYLPLHGQLTVRYLFVLYPLGVYGLARLGPVRRAVTTTPRPAGWGFAVGAVGVLVGASVLLAGLGPARPEAVQAHALLDLALATGLALAVTGRTLRPGTVASRHVAAALGATAGATATYYALAAFEYFTDGAYALDLSEIVADLVTVL